MTLCTEHGITFHNGGIRICYGPTGELYCLPVYVINPPNKFGKITEEQEKPPEVPTENLNVYLHK